MKENWTFLQRGPLLVTPIPDRRETAIGYVLRLAQANGYHSPTMFLPKGNEEQASARGGSVQTLMKLTGMSAERAGRLVIQRSSDGYQLFEHVLASRELSLNYHRICPACVEEDGLFDASWHLVCITHCAKHGLELMEQCDAFGKGLGLIRQGVGICRCDRRLICSERGGTCSRELLSVIRATRSRLYGDRKIAAAPTTLPYFDQLDLPSFLAVIRSMHKHVAAHRGFKIGDKRMNLQIMEVVARAMHAFSKGLRAVQTALHDGSIMLPGHGSGSEGSFNWYYDRQYELRSMPELSFVGDAIRMSARGGTDRFAKPNPCPSSSAKRSPRVPKGYGLAGRSWEDQWVSLEEFVAQTGCSSAGLQRALDLKLIRGSMKRPGIQTIHRSELARLKPSRHAGLEPSLAAGFLGISPDLLEWLAVYRNLPLTFVPDTGGPYALEDIARIRASFLAARGRELKARSHMSLPRFLNASPHIQKLSACQVVRAIENPEMKIAQPERRRLAGSNLGAARNKQPGSSAARRWYSNHLAKEISDNVDEQLEEACSSTSSPEPVSDDILWAVVDRLIAEKLAKTLNRGKASNAAKAAGYRKGIAPKASMQAQD